MSLLERYIGMAIVRATAMTVLVLVVLLMFFSLVEELEEVGRGDYQVLDAFLVGALSAPRYMFEIFPVAALIGSLIGLGGLASHSELVAMRAAGFSMRAIMLAVLKTGVLMMVVVLVFGELVAPASEQFAQQWRIEKQERQVTMKSQHGFWARDGQAFINIRQIDSGVHLRDIYIYEFDAQDRLRLATHAMEAKYQGDFWTLHDIAQSQVSETGVEVRKLAQARWSSLLDPALLSAVVIQPTMLPIWRLSSYIDFMRANGQSAIDYQVAYWMKLANPLATLVMLLLAVPFVLGNLRTISMGQRIFLGAVVGAGFFLLTRTLSYVAVIYHLNPALTAMLPAAIFITLTLLLNRRIR
jgi:lipopolysaccharide export system permease protein